MGDKEMTHEELKEVGFELNKCSGNFVIEIFESLFIEFHEDDKQFCMIYIWGYHPHEYFYVPIGSNFTPESLKQLIDILKKAN